MSAVTLFAATGLCLAVAGCASAQTSDVSDTAKAFSAAMSGGDGTKACALLTTDVAEAVSQDRGGACAEVILEEGWGSTGEVVSVQVAGQRAWVVLDTDTVFLSRFPDGWRVIAAGCTTRDTARPYDCVIQAD